MDLLTDLHDLAVRAGTEDAFAGRVATLEAKHARKTAFLRRLEEAGLRAAPEPD